jgi:hypothetical protein
LMPGKLDEICNTASSTGHLLVPKLTTNLADSMLHNLLFAILALRKQASKRLFLQR